MVLLRQDRRTNVNWRQPNTELTCLHVAALNNAVRITAALLAAARIECNPKEVLFPQPLVNVICY